MASVIMTKDGRVTIPKKIRDAINLRPGDPVEVKASGPGRVFVKKVGSEAEDDHVIVGPARSTESR